MNHRAEMEEIARRTYQWSIIAGAYGRLFEAVAVMRRKVRVKAKLAELDSTFLRRHGMSHLKHGTPYYQNR